MTITGASLLITADTDTLYGGGENPQGSNTLDNRGRLHITVTVTGVAKPLDCKELMQVNVTEVAMEGCDLTAHVGKEATLQIVVDGAALLYMIGFGK